MGPAVRQLPLVCPGHKRDIRELQYSPPSAEGTFLISACHDGTPMLRDGVTGDWIGSFVGHKGAVWGSCLAADAALAATAGADFSARLWNAVTGACVSVLPQKHICKSVAFSNDSRSLLTGGNTSAINLYDVASTEETPVAMLTRPDPAEKASVILARFANNRSDTVVSASADPAEKKQLSIWDVRSGKLERGLDTGATCKSGELSIDGTLLSVTCDDATVSVFDLQKMERVRRFKVPQATESASVRFPDMDMVATGGQDLVVRRFAPVSPQSEELVEMEANRGHHGPVWVMRFAPDGATYASGSNDGTIRIWVSEIDPDLCTSST